MRGIRLCVHVCGGVKMRGIRLCVHVCGGIRMREKY